jgi:hypothetical protein
VAPWNEIVIDVLPTLTPTTTPCELTVAVPSLADDHVAPWAFEMSSFVPSRSVAVADICCVLVRPSAQGSGERPMAETLDDEVDEPVALHADTANASKHTLTAILFFMEHLSGGAA